MRIETHIERPVVIEAAMTPLLDSSDDGGLPRKIIRVVGDIRFASGSALLLPASRTRLDQFIDWLRRGEADMDYFIEVQGHTDRTGSDEQNRLLGRARAEVVRRYLCTKMRLPVDRIGIVSAGSLSPAATGDSPKSRSRNRRAVLLVLR